jgi:site-specific DNA-methyltransferase (adenine-specific)
MPEIITPQKRINQIIENIPLVANKRFNFKLLKENIKIVQADCLLALDKIESNSVDCIITDPPYFLDGMENNWNLEKLQEKKDKAKVIGGLPVGMKFDPQQGKRLQEFMSEVAKKLLRVLKPGGFFLCFSQGRLYHRMVVAIEETGFEIRDMLIWKKTGQAKAFSQDHFVKKMKISEKEKKIILNSLANRKTPQLKSESEPIVLAQKPKEGTFITNWIKWETGLINIDKSLNGNFPSTVMDVRKPTGKERIINHMTLKPVKLIENLTLIFTKKNQVILDPFMGSGTTGIACLNTDRKFIGIEINDYYFSLAENRLKEHE